MTIPESVEASAQAPSPPLVPAAGPPTAVLQAAAAVDGYSAAFTVAAVIFLAGVVITPILLRGGRLEPSEATPLAI